MNIIKFVKVNFSQDVLKSHNWKPSSHPTHRDFVCANCDLILYECAGYFEENIGKWRIRFGNKHIENLTCGEYLLNSIIE